MTAIVSNVSYPPHTVDLVKKTLKKSEKEKNTKKNLKSCPHFLKSNLHFVTFIWLKQHLYIEAMPLYGVSNTSSPSNTVDPEKSGKILSLDSDSNCKCTWTLTFKNFYHWI